MTERVPTGITLHQKSRVMEITFTDGRTFRLPYEFLRVYSPSAEVRGHGPGQEVLQAGKRNVEIRGVEPVGSYAVQPQFSTATARASTPGTTCTSSARTRLALGRIPEEACRRRCQP